MKKILSNIRDVTEKAGKRARELSEHKHVQTAKTRATDAAKKAASDAQRFVKENPPNKETFQKGVDYTKQNPHQAAKFAFLTVAPFGWMAYGAYKGYQYSQTSKTDQVPQAEPVNENAPNGADAEQPKIIFTPAKRPKPPLL